MKKVQNLQMIEVRYISATNNKDSRIKLIDLRFNVSIIIPYDYECNDIKDMAIDYLTLNGFNIIAKTFDDKNKRDYLFLSDFTPIKKA